MIGWPRCGKMSDWKADPTGPEAVVKVF